MLRPSEAFRVILLLLLSKVAVTPEVPEPWLIPAASSAPLMAAPLVVKAATSLTLKLYKLAVSVIAAKSMHYCRVRSRCHVEYVCVIYRENLGVGTPGGPASIAGTCASINRSAYGDAINRQIIGG